MFRVRDIWTWLGAGLSLVALYLVLEHGAQASTVIGASAGGLSQIYRTLQGR
jgi:hypothetical protein